MAALVVQALCVTSCGRAAEQTGTTVVNDSSGVRVVQNSAPDIGTPFQPESENPVAVLGIGDDPRGLLEDVSGAASLSDGRVVVLDRAARELKVYRADGSFAGTWAGPGESPGEFRFPSNLERSAGDSVHVWDRRLGREYTFGPNGVLTREVNLLQTGLPSVPHLARLGPGRWVADVAMLDRIHAIGHGKNGVLTELPIALVAVSASGVEDTIGVLPGLREIEMGTSSITPALGFQSPWTVIARGVVVGTGREAEFRTLGQNGRLVQITRWKERRVRVDRSKLIELARSIGSFSPDDPLVDPGFLPEWYPVYKQLRDSMGRYGSGPRPHSSWHRTGGTSLMEMAAGSSRLHSSQGPRCLIVHSAGC